MENQQTPVFINLLAIARYDQMPDYPIQFMTTGKLYYKNPGEALLQYVESQEDEETGEITRADISLSLSDGKVTMQRSGDFSNTMVFSSGKRFEGTYHTPYGEMDMAVYTKQAACRFGSSEGNIHLKYQLNIQGNYASTNELHLEYKTEQAKAGRKMRTES
jgi:uncharacterized beta-barrel protein YwiB (DUF1934 family)